MLDAVINVLIKNLVESLVNEGSRVLEFHKQFKTVNQELQLMQSYIKQVEKVRRKDHKEILKAVVGQLRELLYDAEDIISDCELFFISERRKRAGSKFKRCCSPSFLKFRCQMGKKLLEINQEIKSHREKMRSYLPTEPIILNQEQLGNCQPARYPVLINNAEIVGLDGDVEKIKQWILNPHESLNIIGIVGMGGIGKTTLAQKIYNDSDVKNYFHYVLMVTVSQAFKIEETIKNLLKKISGPKDFTNIDAYDLLKELQDLLEGKKCLIILDDVWEPEGSWWESLKSAFPQRDSCVIVTTRKEDVARLMGATEMYTHHPKLLADDDSWSLFSKIAFAKERQCPNPELEHMGREVVNRCGGLPLAIKVIGGMMKSKGNSINEWERISKNLKEELMEKNGDPIFSVLELSYNELPLHLKPCMLCFSGYSEDYEIVSLDIIAWWIGEGFVRGNDHKSAYDIGKEYVDELISRCLLLLEYTEVFGNKIYPFKVHDMVVDMIRRIAKEENFTCIKDGGPGQSSCIQSRRISMVMNADMNLFKEEETNLKALRTITGIDLKETQEFIQNMGSKLSKLKRLRVLHICFQGSSLPAAVNWLSGIGSLQHLVCLKIENSGLERLPDSIGDCKSLQILHIFNCPNFSRLPKSVASLEKLSILNLVYCDSLEWLPMEIGNLRQLCILSFSMKSIVKNGFRISELKKFAQLRVLRLVIASEDGIEEGELKVLSELTELNFLVLEFSFSFTDDQLLSKLVGHELSPIQQLSELYLFNYQGEGPPSWLNLPLFQIYVIFSFIMVTSAA